MPSMSQLIHHLFICGSLINQQTDHNNQACAQVCSFSATDFPLTLFKMKLKKFHNQDSLYNSSPFTNKALICCCTVRTSHFLTAKLICTALQVKTNTEDYLLLVLGPGSAELSTTQPLSQTLHCHNKERNFPNKSEPLCNHASMLFRSGFSIGAEGNVYFL